MNESGPDAHPTGSFVSSGTLPPPNRVQSLVTETHRRFKDVTDGALSTVYPALAQVAPHHFGLTVHGVDGQRYSAGESQIPFTIMSVAKPFTFALVCEAVGGDRAAGLVGVNATGLPFNSAAAVETSPGGRTNPMVNAGAIATAALAPGSNAEEKWQWLREGLSRFAGRELALNPAVSASASASNHRNRALANLLYDSGGLGCEPAMAVEVYSRQSCLEVTTADLSVMGATLANGGVQPVTGDRVVAAADAHATLAVMATAGLYETTGEWLYRVGLPGKSGIGGGIVTVSPGKGALATYSPLLDRAGNSVRGQFAAEYLSRSLGLDVFATATHR